jgi:hypothetical protein
MSENGQILDGYSTCIMNPEIYHKNASLTVVKALIELVYAEDKMTGKYLLSKLMS